MEEICAENQTRHGAKKYGIQNDFALLKTWLESSLEKSAVTLYETKFDLKQPESAQYKKLQEIKQANVRGQSRTTNTKLQILGNWRKLTK